MKEILFRGKRILDDKWVYGVPYESLNGNGSWYMFGLHEDINQSMSHAKVNPETIGQYTGSVDKNGVKIFEGDIVDASDEWWNASGPAGHGSPLMEVEWVDWVCGFFPFADYDCDCGVYIDASGCKVVGNIHDNPELLKK